MPAYNRGSASLESYLVKIIAALCRNAGGELRIRGDLIDVIDQPVTLLKDWDSRTQELVLRTHMGSFGEVFKAIPEKQPARETLASPTLETPAAEPKPNGTILSTPPVNVGLDNERLVDLERKLLKRRVARLIRDEQDAARRQGAGTL